MNRAAFLRQSAAELERARRASLPLSLISLDIDKFKSINDSFGSQSGDDVLRIVAQIIREKSRPYDCIGRWMGDEFVILVNGVIGVDAEKIAERIFYFDITPTTKPDPIKVGGTLKEMLEYDAKAEEEAIDLYKEIIKVAAAEGDSTTRLLFEQILAEEEEHHDTFTTLLGK
ncbi:MAG: diguanylate cyclase [Syntrophaceae bacterium]|nr:diguanylate cyclase [Syntrophaceae bacterium]